MVIEWMAASTDASSEFKLLSMEEASSLGEIVGMEIMELMLRF